MTKNRIEFIYWDMGKVLLLFDNSLICPQIAAAAEVPEPLVREFFRDPSHQLGLEAGLCSFDEVYERFADHIQRRPDKKRIRYAVSDIFDVNLETIPIVASLAAAGYRMGILSNTCEPHWEFICARKFAVIPNYFETRVLSYEIKAMKPDRRIFDAAAELAAVDPHSIFFTDDMPENVQGALDAGWNAVQYTSSVQLANSLREHGVCFNY